MTSSVRIGQRALWGFSLLMMAAVYAQACGGDSKYGGGGGGDGGNGSLDASLVDAAQDATDASEAADGSRDGATDASWSDAIPFDAHKTGFITWTYDGKPYGLYVPEPAGKPLPVVTYLHACHSDPVDPDYWLIAAANVTEPCAVFLPTTPRRSTRRVPIGEARTTQRFGRT